MSKYTETQHQTALMLVAAGKTIREIAEAVDAKPGTVQRHLLQDADPYQDAKDRRADLIRSERWARAFDRGDRASAKFLDDLAVEQLPETRDARKSLNAPSPEESRAEHIAEALDRFASQLVPILAARRAELASGDPD